jgi:uncharacterized membrane protein YphA (DoxX/SURF4 family)
MKEVRVFPTALRLSPELLRTALGILIGAEGTLNIIQALSAQPDYLLLAFGAAEAAGAVLVLWPRAVLFGACFLSCTFLVAAVVHVSGGDFPFEHLVYAVAVLFVVSHSPSATPDGQAAA